jgi:hypothetical protein
MLKIREKCQFLLENWKITQYPGETFSLLGSDRESGEISWILDSPVYSGRSDTRTCLLHFANKISHRNDAQPIYIKFIIIALKRDSKQWYPEWVLVRYSLSLEKYQTGPEVKYSRILSYSSLVLRSLCIYAYKIKTL